MRVIVFFDLPVQTGEQRREYTHNMSVAGAIMENVRQHKPPEGLVQMLVVTEKQFARMEFVVGEAHTEIVDSDERTVFL